MSPKSPAFCARVKGQQEAALAVVDGGGRNGVWLAEQDLQVNAIDFPDIAIHKAQALAQSRKMKINCVSSN